MDYAAQTLIYHSNMNHKFNEILFEQMELESQYILESLGMVEVVTEAPVTDPQGNKANFFARLIEFLKTVFKTFVNKIKQLVANDKTWLQKNYTLFDDINTDGLEINIIPFWNVPVNQIDSLSGRVFSAVRGMTNDPSKVDKFDNIEELKNQAFKQYLDENGNMVNGLKNYFRTGKAAGPLQQVKLGGSELKTKILQEMRTYCKDYESKILPMVQKQINESEKDIQLIERNLKNRRPAKEQFCLIENMLLSQTELGYTILQEADGQQDTNQVDRTVTKPTKVTMTDHGDAKTAEKNDTYETLSTKELTMLKNLAQINQWVVTSVMTVCEERYHAYMTVMRQVLKARGVKKKSENDASDASQVNVKDTKK
jgi:hypothetical protein